MTRRTERLSRLLRLWLTTMPSDFTTMPSDFTTFPRLLRLSPERLCDFPARVSDFDRAADLPTRSAAFPFPGLIVSAWGAAGPPGALPVRLGRCRSAWGAAGPPGALPVRLGRCRSAWGAAGPPGALPVRLGRCRCRVFAQFAKNLDYFLYLHLTGKCKYAILYLPKGSKYKCTLKITSPYISPCRPVK